MKHVLLWLVWCAVLAGAPKLPSFSARHDYPAAIGFVALGDVNGDGVVDVVGISTLGITTLLGNGNGTFRPGPTTNTPGAQFLQGVLVDLNGDGILDLVGSNYGYGLGVCFGTGGGNFQTPIVYHTGSDHLTGQVVVGDFNSDGIPDVIVRNLAVYGCGRWRVQFRDLNPDDTVWGYNKGKRCYSRF